MSDEEVLDAEPEHADLEYFRFLLQTDYEAQLISYIEQSFNEPSWNNQLRIMLKFPYFGLKILKDYEYDNDVKLNKFFDVLRYGKSKIITIIGGRGSGKTAMAMFCVEKMYEEGIQKNVYYVKQGERPEWLPSLFYHVQTMEEVPNGSIAIIDETAIEYSSRNFYDEKNKSFTDRLVILRHKDISVILITQHSKLVDINIRRLSDIVILKKNANIDKEDETEQTLMIIERLMPRDSKHALIIIKDTHSYWSVRTGLPSFWDDELVSKTFKDYSPEQRRREEKSRGFKVRMEEYREKEKIKAETFKEKESFRAEKKLEVAIKKKSYKNNKLPEKEEDLIPR